MRKAVEDWLRWCAMYRTTETQAQYGRVIRTFLATLGDPPPRLDAVGTAHIEQYINIRSAGRCRNTVSHDLRVVSSFWTWAAKRYNVPSPMQSVPLLPEDDPDQRFLTKDEYATVLAACARPIERDMIQLYGNTGLRREEMRMLRWKHVSADLRALKVPHGKGNKARTVPLNGICRDILERNRVDDTFAFLERWRCRSAHNALCRRLAGRAGIVAFGPHALRHYFATRLIRRGVPLKIVSMILGHASVSITEQIYCHIAPVDLLGVTDALDQ